MGREDWIDRWKGLLIVLVVAGHVFGGACHLSTGHSQVAMEYLYKLIYMFHMPAFFWIAGYCWKPKNDGFATFAVAKARRLLIPYLVFGTMSILIYLVTSNAILFSSATTSYYQGKGLSCWWQPIVSLVHAGGWPHGEGFRCNSVLWFLPAMFTILCLYHMIDRLLKGRKTQLILAVVLFVIEFLRRKYFHITLPLGLSHVTWYMPFVFLGRWVRLPDIKFRWVMLIFGWVLFCWLTWIEPNYYAGQFEWTWYGVFLVMAIVGVLLSMITAKIFSGELLVSLGQTSLGIMLMHKFIVLFMQVKLPYIRAFATSSTVLFWMSNVLVVVVAVAISWLATILIRKLMPWSLGEVVRK